MKLKLPPLVIYHLDITFNNYTFLTKKQKLDLFDFIPIN